MSISKFFWHLFIFLLYFAAGLLLVFFYFRNSLFLSSQKQTSLLQQISIKPQFSLENAPTDSLRGAIVTLSGQVFWKSRTASESAQIFQPQQVQQGEAVETKKEGFANIEIAEGLIILMSQNSMLDFIQTLKTNFLLQQNFGAISYVKSNYIPLTIRIDNLIIKLGSGELNAVSDINGTQITLELARGRATLAYNDNNFVTQIVEMADQETIVFDKEEKTIKRKSSGK